MNGGIGIGTIVVIVDVATGGVAGSAGLCGVAEAVAIAV